jgi:muconolactone delta-isomerase
MLFHARMDVRIPHDLDPEVRADTVAREKAYSQGRGSRRTRPTSTRRTAADRPRPTVQPASSPGSARVRCAIRNAVLASGTPQ